METSKVTLSPQEWALVQDPAIILTKNLVIEKVYSLFGQVALSYQKITADLPAAYLGDWLQWTPKISRGEKYRDLPWVMLDYPRQYSAEETIAIRSFFGWGSEFSIHLILQGESRDRWLTNARHWKETAHPEWMLDMSDDPWQHHRDQQRCVPLCKIDEQELKERPFIKYSCWQPLTVWESIPELWSAIFTEWVKIPGIAGKS